MGPDSFNLPQNEQTIMKGLKDKWHMLGLGFWLWHGCRVYGGQLLLCGCLSELRVEIFVRNVMFHFTETILSFRDVHCDLEVSESAL